MCLLRSSTIYVVSSVLIISWLAAPSVAQCWWLDVSGSEFNAWTGVNGQYSFVEGVTVNGAIVWKQQYTATPPNYIFYFFFNTTVSGWAICPMIQTGPTTATCVHGSIPYVIEDDGVYFRPYPYDVPVGDWAELNVSNPPSMQAFVKNPVLNVSCLSYSSVNSGLTAGEVCGIVIGVTIGTALVIVFLLCLCKKIEAKKRRCIAANSNNSANVAGSAAITQSTGGIRRCAPAAMNPYVIYSPPAYNATATGNISATLPVFAAPDYTNSAVFPGHTQAPPSYDDSLPPVYEAIATM